METYKRNEKNSQQEKKKSNKNRYLENINGNIVIKLGKKVTIQIPSSAFPYIVIALAVFGMALAIIGIVIVVFLFMSDPSLASIR